MSKQKRYLEWDTSNLSDAQVQSEIDRQKECYDETITPEQARENIWQDADYWSIAWDDMLDALTEWMQEKNNTRYWRVDGSNLGWRHLSGHKYFTARDGQELLRAILPDTDCIFKIESLDRYAFVISNYHHDAPTGESYIVRKATIKEQNAGYFD